MRVHPAEGERLRFRCPGCGDSHIIRVGAAANPRWSWNGSHEFPTFSPSLLVRSGHYCNRPGFDKVDCWCTYYEARPTEEKKYSCYVCHSFINDGRIQFLGDCTHALAGKTVDLPDIEP